MSSSGPVGYRSRRHYRANPEWTWGKGVMGCAFKKQRMIVLQGRIQYVADKRRTYTERLETSPMGAALRMNISAISGTFTILLIGALLCVLMLLVLSSLHRSDIAGIKEWALANMLGSAAMILYALGRVLPPFIAYEVTNAVYAAASAMILVGFQRFFGSRVRWTVLGGGVLVLAAAIALFHYQYDSYALRTLIVAVFQSVVCIAIAVEIAGSRTARRSSYPYWFTQAMLVIVVFGQTARSLVHLMNPGEASSLLQPSPWNLLFLSLGTFILPVLTFGAVMMVHDRMMVNAEHAANRDFLTGAWSRRAFFELAQRELALARRKGRSLALLLLDVDHFKAINDSAGHAAGDKVLIDVVARAHTAIRNVDYFGRIGGEEFAVLLPETDLASAQQVAERLRAVLDRRSPAGIAYTVSIGLAMLHGDESLHDLMTRADAALYAAKTAGRNRVACAPDQSNHAAIRPAPFHSERTQSRKSGSSS